MEEMRQTAQTQETKNAEELYPVHVMFSFGDANNPVDDRCFANSFIITTKDNFQKIMFRVDDLFKTLHECDIRFNKEGNNG